MEMIKWNRMRGMEWNWIRASVTEVIDRKNEMGMDGHEWIENKDVNENEKQRCQVILLIYLLQAQRSMIL